MVSSCPDADAGSDDVAGSSPVPGSGGTSWVPSDSSDPDTR